MRSKTTARRVSRNCHAWRNKQPGRCRRGASMRLRPFTNRLCVVLVFFAALTTSVSAQQRQWSKDELIAEAREIMTTTRYCALITIDKSGRAQARTMDAFAPD